MNNCNNMCYKDCNLDIIIIQGDTYRNIYKFYDKDCNLIDDDVLLSVYFTCDRLGYTKELTFNDANEGWELFIPAETTTTFPYLKTQYNLTFAFTTQQIVTPVYRANIQVCEKQIKPIAPTEYIGDDYYDDIITEVETNIVFTDGITDDYNLLVNKPSINGVTLIGNKTPANLNIIEDKNFMFVQNSASSIWNINHNLNKYPSVMVVDSGNNVVIGDITYNNKNSITIQFSAPFSGYAYLN